MKKPSILTIAIFLLALSGQAVAAVQASLNQNRAYIGDPVTLTITVDGSANVQPDLSVLKKSFQILGTGTSSNMSMINGVTRSTKSWNITLMPSGKGHFTIPAIPVGGDKTQPLALTVTDIPPQVKAKLRDHVILEASTGNHQDKVYVQQQISYTVKLLTDSSIISGELITPQVENAVVEQISEDKRYQVTRNGKQFNVIERHFVISPERSGRLNIPPTQFRGKMKKPRTRQQAPSRRRRSFDNFFNDPFSRDFFGHDPFADDFFANSPFGNPGQPIRTSSNALSIKVLPIPPSYTGKSWLPAEDIKIQDSWAEHLPEFKVGEPVERSLHFQAKGLSGSQIPALDLGTPHNMRLYPDQPKTETRTDGETVYGISDQSVTYIPSKAGKITIPAITIDWWNTQTGKQEAVTVAARTVTVLPGAGGITETEPEPAPPAAAASAPTSGAIATAPKQKAPINEKGSARTVWVGAAILLLATLIAFLWRFFAKKRPVPATAGEKPAKSTPQKPQINERAIRQSLQKACDSNDAREAAELLLTLATAKWPESPPKSLGALATRVTRGKEAIRQLDRQLYAPANSTWDGSELWEAIKNGLQTEEASRQNSGNGIEALYPTRE